MAVAVSVIVPVYNRASTLTECVRSLQAQSLSDFEILLIDDGSTDDSPALSRKLAQEDDRIRLIWGDHGGVSAARNRGLDAAGGKYILFVDSDDAIHPLLAETLLTAMEKEGAAMGGSLYQNIRNSQWKVVETLIAQSPGPGETTLHSNLEAINATCWGNTPFSAMGGIMIRRDLIGATRFRTDLHIGEDWYFIYECLLKGPSAIFLTPRWYYARLHSENSSNDFSLNGFLTRFHRRKLVWTSEEALGRKDNARRQKQDAFAIFLKFLHRGKMSKQDRRQMCNTMKTHKKDILPALSLGKKLRFHLHVNFPGSDTLIKPFHKK